MDDYLIWSLVLFGLGLLVVAVEVLVPSGGLLGLVSGALLVGSLFCAYKSSGVALAVMAIVEAACIPVVVVVMFRVLPRTRLGRQLILSPPASPGSSDHADAGRNDDHNRTLMGADGVLVTMCRPSGTAEFAGRRVSVVSGGEIIAAGRRVRVVQVEGNRVVVEATDESDAADGSAAARDVS